MYIWKSIQIKNVFEIHYNNDNYCDIHVYDFGDGHVVGDSDDYHGNCVFI